MKNIDIINEALAEISDILIELNKTLYGTNCILMKILEKEGYNNNYTTHTSPDIKLCRPRLTKEQLESRKKQRDIFREKREPNGEN